MRVGKRAGFIIGRLIKIGLADNGRGNALFGDIDLGLARQQRFAELDRARQVVRRVAILRRTRRRSGAFRTGIAGEGLRRRSTRS